MKTHDHYLRQLRDQAASTTASLDTPWTLHFDRDGTEDIAVIRDANGYDLVTSRHFWLPHGGEPVPTTLATVRVMAIAPKLLQALKDIIAEADGGWLRESPLATAALTALAQAEGRAS